MAVFTFRMRIDWLAGALSLVLLAAPTRAQQLNNDGFQRRNGQMQVLRNGLPRPMTRDAHLPTGVTVTKDGFVLRPDGQRSELREGQGCNLRGQPVAVLTAANGLVVFAAPAAPVVADRGRAGRSLLEEIFGGGDEDDRFFKFKKSRKHHGKGHGRGHWKEEEDDD